MRVGQYKPNLRIAELRKKRGMTQAELGNRSGLGPTGQVQVSMFENGSRVPTWDTLVRLAKALGCKNLNDLFGPMPLARSRPPTISRRPKK